MLLSCLAEKNTERSRNYLKKQVLESKHAVLVRRTFQPSTPPHWPVRPWTSNLLDGSRTAKVMLCGCLLLALVLHSHPYPPERCGWALCTQMQDFVHAYGRFVFRKLYILGRHGSYWCNFGGTRCHFSRILSNQAFIKSKTIVFYDKWRFLWKT